MKYSQTSHKRTHSLQLGPGIRCPFAGGVPLREVEKYKTPSINVLDSSLLTHKNWNYNKNNFIFIVIIIIVIYEFLLNIPKEVSFGSYWLIFKVSKLSQLGIPANFF